MRRQNLKPSGGVGCSTRVSYDAVYTLIRLLVVACLRDWFAATVPCGFEARADEHFELESR